MHKSALLNGSRFFQTYVQHLDDPLVLDLGSQDVFGSLRSVLPANARYIGVDMAPGPGVDVVVPDAYVLPFATGSVDVVVSSSCFEHAEFFWLSFLEILRVLSPRGLVYLNIPSNGAFHRYPVDCWRFYPDSGRALARWGQRNGFAALLLESYVSDQYQDRWNDFVCVILRDSASLPLYPARILPTISDYSNGLCHPDLERFLNPQELSEDQRRLETELAARGQ
ncbi:MAG TPA: methyltransferase domain-containing protein [Burkholderiaceae bacterium]|nr:methyltransferase domain-containing protein [Burkholderiaceae bacterium]